MPLRLLATEVLAGDEERELSIVNCLIQLRWIHQLRWIRSIINDETAEALNRDRGGRKTAPPPTPPGMRVRTRRFGRVDDLSNRDKQFLYLVEPTSASRH